MYTYIYVFKSMMNTLQLYKSKYCQAFCGEVGVYKLRGRVLEMANIKMRMQTIVANSVILIKHILMKFKHKQSIKTSLQGVLCMFKKVALFQRTTCSTFNYTCSWTES